MEPVEGSPLQHVLAVLLEEVLPRVRCPWPERPLAEEALARVARQPLLLEAQQHRFVEDHDELVPQEAEAVLPVLPKEQVNQVAAALPLRWLLEPLLRFELVQEADVEDLL